MYYEVYLCKRGYNNAIFVFHQLFKSCSVVILLDRSLLFQIDFEKWVIYLLNVIKLNQDRQRNTLEKLSEHIIQLRIPEGYELQQETILPKLPLTTLKGFLNFEKLLNTNKVAMAHCVQYFKNIGGSSLSDATRRILYATFDKDLATSFSWLGQKNNYKLKDTGYSKALFAAVKSRKYEDNICSDRDIETAIINWCRHAADRVRAHRSKVSN
ncbi:uncharacterized protein LOC107275036 [Cephus cinctus]|uniref:Uncharacterized protein LOC107275036 n=1 Tax=Cephus cinctus TaxID=211228 RepID=A0AAJ7CHX0_CEPCN|nr:uncharacterized protein LOC107275036 [Cephus cinctus]